MQYSQTKTVQKKYVNEENIVKNVEWTVQTNNVQKRVVNSTKAAVSSKWLQVITVE
jgi:hypothetical protein